MGTGIPDLGTGIRNFTWNLIGRRKFALACLHFVPLGHGFGDVHVDVALDPFVVPGDGDVATRQLFVYMLPPEVKG